MDFEETRWNYFLECTCYDIDDQRFCGTKHVAGRSLGYDLLSQCLPYIQYLALRAIGWLLPALVLPVLFFVVLFARCICNVLGGYKPSKGWVFPSRRSSFPGYSKKEFRYFRLIVVGATSATGITALVLFGVNSRLDHALSDIADIVRGTVNSMETGITEGRQLFDALSFLSNDVVNNIAYVLTQVWLYASNARESMVYLDDVNGVGLQFGRTQIVDLIVGVTILIAVVGTVLGVFGLSVRGVIHTVLGILVAVATLAVAAIPIAHYILAYALTDSCTYANQLTASLATQQAVTCGSAAQSLTSLAESAEAQLIAFECNQHINELCSKYFFCIYNACLQPVAQTSIVNLTITLGVALLLEKVPGTNWTFPVNVSLIQCIQDDVTHCYGNPAAQDAAKAATVSVLFFGNIFSKLYTDVLPRVQCSLGLGTVQDLTAEVCSMSDISLTVVQAGTFFFAFSWIMAIVFLLGAKRFSRRNLSERVEARRLKKAMQLLEKEQQRKGEGAPVAGLQSSNAELLLGAINEGEGSAQQENNDGLGGGVESNPAVACRHDGTSATTTQDGGLEVVSSPLVLERAASMNTIGRQPTGISGGPAVAAPVVPPILDAAAVEAVLEAAASSGEEESDEEGGSPQEEQQQDDESRSEAAAGIGALLRQTSQYLQGFFGKKDSQQQQHDPNGASDTTPTGEANRLGDDGGGAPSSGGEAPKKGDRTE